MARHVDWISAVSGLVLLLVPAMGTAAEPVLSTQQMTALTGDKADKRVQSDLLSIFEPVRSISSGGMIRLRGVTMWTRPYPERFEGLCRRDGLELKYRPQDSAQRGRAAAIRPYGVEVWPEFHASHPPRKASADTEGPDWDDACDALADREDVAWFSAKDAAQAAEATYWLQATVDLVKAGKLHVTSCEKFPVTKISCDEIITQRARVPGIMEVESCANEGDLKCLVIDIDGFTDVTIKGRPGADRLAPSAIVSVDIAQFVIVT